VNSVFGAVPVRSGLEHLRICVNDRSKKGAWGGSGTDIFGFGRSVRCCSILITSDGSTRFDGIQGPVCCGRSSTAAEIPIWGVKFRVRHARIADISGVRALHSQGQIVNEKIEGLGQGLKVEEDFWGNFEMSAEVFDVMFVESALAAQDF
jgi:hypothetical protein